MEEQEATRLEVTERWIVAVRVEVEGRNAPAADARGRRLARRLTAEELAALTARLCAAAEEYLSEVGVLGDDAGGGWVEAQGDGSWAWQMEPTTAAPQGT
jgi:hypothetical protein